MNYDEAMEGQQALIDDQQRFVSKLAKIARESQEQYVRERELLLRMQEGLSAIMRDELKRRMVEGASQ